MNHYSTRFYNEYKQNDITTASQGRLILLMYDGAIRNTRQALDNLESKNIAGKSTHIRRAHDIINELSLALDVKKGGEIAEKLEKLYQFILRQFTIANIKNDRKPLDSILRILGTLNAGWEEVIKKEENHLETTPQKSITTRY